MDAYATAKAALLTLVGPCPLLPDFAYGVTAHTLPGSPRLTLRPIPTDGMALCALQVRHVVYLVALLLGGGGPILGSSLTSLGPTPPRSPALVPGLVWQAKDDISHWEALKLPIDVHATATRTAPALPQQRVCRSEPRACLALGRCGRST
jgi:hypothetical protein